MRATHCCTLTAALVLAFLAANADCGSIPQDILFYDIGDKIAEWQEAAVPIEGLGKKPAKWGTVGSGFLVLKTTVFIVTNEHVIRGSDSLRVALNTDEGKQLVRAVPILVEKGLDVAILYPQGRPRLKINQKSVGLSFFETDHRPGTGVVTVGYPLGLGTEANKNYPISRIGIVAQAVPDSATFLIDGIASHGNSGSAVFSTRSSKLLGVIAKFHNDTITAFDDNGNLIARLPYNSGLAVAVSASAVMELFDTITVRELGDGRVTVSFPTQAP